MAIQPTARGLALIFALIFMGCALEVGDDELGGDRPTIGDQRAALGNCLARVRVHTTAPFSPATVRFEYTLEGSNDILTVDLDVTADHDTVYERPDGARMCHRNLSLRTTFTPAPAHDATLDGSEYTYLIWPSELYLFRVEGRFIGTHTYAATDRPEFDVKIPIFTNTLPLTVLREVTSTCNASYATAPASPCWITTPHDGIFVPTGPPPPTASLVGYATPTLTETEMSHPSDQNTVPWGHNLYFAFDDEPGVDLDLIDFDTSAQVPTANVTITLGAQAPVALTYDAADQHWSAVVDSNTTVPYVLSASATGYAPFTETGIFAPGTHITRGTILLRPFDANARIRVFVTRQKLPFSLSPTPGATIVFRDPTGAVTSVPLAPSNTWAGLNARLSGRYTFVVNPPTGWSSASGSVDVAVHAGGDIDTSVTVSELSTLLNTARTANPFP